MKGKFSLFPVSYNSLRRSSVKKRPITIHVRSIQILKRFFEDPTSRSRSGNDCNILVSVGLFLAMLNSSSLFSTHTLYFPTLSVKDGFVGVAISNTSEQPTKIAFKAYDGKGSLLKETSYDLGKSSQLARLTSEIFGKDIEDINGWFLAQSDQQIKSFFLSGGPSSLDGALAFERLSTKLWVIELTNATLEIINPQQQETSLDILLRSSKAVESKKLIIPANGKIRQKVAEWFPTLTVDSYIEILASQGVCVFETFGSAKDQAALPALTESDQRIKNYVTHIGVTEAFATVLTLVNPHNIAIPTVIELKNTDGQLVSLTQNPLRLVLGPYQKTQRDLGSLFNASNLSGYVEVTAEGYYGVLASATFGTKDNRALSTVVPFIASTDFVFSHVAQTRDFFTGLAFLNPSKELTNVSIAVLNASGNVLRSTNFTLKSGQKIAKLLSEFLLEPSFAAAGGYIKVSSEKDLLGMELFGNNTLDVLSNVPFLSTFLSLREIVPKTLEKDGQIFLADQVTVLFNEGLVRSKIKQIIQQLGGELVDGVDEWGLYTAHFKDKSDTQMQDIVGKLRSTEGVRFAGLAESVPPLDIPPDYSGNPTQTLHRAFQALNFEEAWKLVSDASKVSVGVIDIGFQKHKEFHSAKGNNISFIKNDFTFVDRTANILLEDLLTAHGTEVASIIGARGDNGEITGGNPNVGLFLAGAGQWVRKSLIAEGLLPSINPSSQVRAFQTLIDNGVKVLNLSLGSFVGNEAEYRLYRDSYSFILDKLLQNNVTVVMGAGNDGKNFKYFLPASLSTRTFEDVLAHPNAISVGALDGQVRAVWEPGKKESNYGDIDFFAPGTNLRIAYPKDGYKENSGTSLAAPIIASLVSLMVSANPDLKPHEIKSILKESAKSIPYQLEGRQYVMWIPDAGLAVRKAKERFGQPKLWPQITTIDPVVLRVNQDTLLTLRGSNLEPGLETVILNSESAEVAKISPRWMKIEGSVFARFPLALSRTGKFQVLLRRPEEPIYSNSLPIEVVDSPFKVTVSTFVGSGTRGYKDGSLTTADLYRPIAITQCTSDYFFFDENSNLTNSLLTGIRKISGSNVSTLNKAFLFYRDIVCGTDGKTLFVASSGRIFKIDPATPWVLPVGADVFVGGDSLGYQDGEGTSARFNNIWGLAIDKAGNIFVADRDNRRIRKVSPTKVVTTIAGSGGVGFSDGPAFSAQFSDPLRVAVDLLGSVYVLDSGGTPDGRAVFRVRSISNNQVKTLLVTDPGTISLTGIGVNSRNQVFVSSIGEVYTLKDGSLILVAGTTLHSGYRDGDATQSRFRQIENIFFDKSDNLIILDAGNFRIRKAVILPR